jgi:hypothetical protein
VRVVRDQRSCVGLVGAGRRQANRDRLRLLPPAAALASPPLALAPPPAQLPPPARARRWRLLVHVPGPVVKAFECVALVVVAHIADVRAPGAEAFKHVEFLVLAFACPEARVESVQALQGQRARIGASRVAEVTLFPFGTVRPVEVRKFWATKSDCVQGVRQAKVAREVVILLAT